MVMVTLSRYTFPFSPIMPTITLGDILFSSFTLFATVSMCEVLFGDTRDRLRKLERQQRQTKTCLQKQQDQLSTVMLQCRLRLRI